MVGSLREYGGTLHDAWSSMSKASRNGTGHNDRHESERIEDARTSTY